MLQSLSKTNHFLAFFFFFPAVADTAFILFTQCIIILPIGFIFYHFEIQSLISQLRSGAWRWETFIIFHLCNSSESASPFQKACNSIYSHECCILLLRMVVHEFIVSKGILMCPSCIYMQDMFCISDKKISIFWCLKSLLGILF